MHISSVHMPDQMKFRWEHTDWQPQTSHPRLTFISTSLCSALSRIGSIRPSMFRRWYVEYPPLYIHRTSIGSMLCLFVSYLFDRNEIITPILYIFACVLRNFKVAWYALFIVESGSFAAKLGHCCVFTRPDHLTLTFQSLLILTSSIHRTLITTLVHTCCMHFVFAWTFLLRIYHGSLPPHSPHEYLSRLAGEAYSVVG